MNRNIDLIEEIMFQRFMLKMILKKIYGLSDKQYDKVIKAFEEESEEKARQYLSGVEERNEYKDLLKRLFDGEPNIKK